MTELEVKLQQIYEETSTKLLPENIKEGVSILGVEGILKENEDLSAELEAQDNVIEALELAVATKAGTALKVPNGMKFQGSKAIPEKLDFSEVIDAASMFYDCSSLTKVPKINTSSATNTSQMFARCSNLVEIPALDVSKSSFVDQLFYSCSKLKALPKLNPARAISFQNMCYDCVELVDVPAFYMNGPEDVYISINVINMFMHCPKLSNDSLNNILASCSTCTKAQDKDKTLGRIGLTEEQATICTTLSNYQAFLDAGWTTGY